MSVFFGRDPVVEHSHPHTHDHTRDEEHTHDIDEELIEKIAVRKANEVIDRYLLCTVVEESCQVAYLWVTTRIRDKIIYNIDDNSLYYVKDQNRNVRSLEPINGKSFIKYDEKVKNHYIQIDNGPMASYVNDKKLITPEPDHPKSLVIKEVHFTKKSKPVYCF